MNLLDFSKICFRVYGNGYERKEESWFGKAQASASYWKLLLIQLLCLLLLMCTCSVHQKMVMQETRLN